MGKIKNECEVNTYDESNPKKIIIKSHWNNDDFVEIIIGKSRVFVSGSNLIAAINNCMNTSF